MLKYSRLQPKVKCLDRWRPPEDDLIKINVDGAFIPGETHAGWGVVAKDGMGNIVGARAGRQDNVKDAFGAETGAMSQAISFADDMGMVRVAFETDSQLLVDALDPRKVDSSAYAAVIEDSKFQLKMWFSHQRIMSCRRSANTVAHELAKLGRMYLPNHFIEWESDVPAHVVICAIGDLPQHR